MAVNLKLNRYAWLGFAAFILLSWLALQQAIIFSPDVSYLLHASKQLLKGAHYGDEIFETNPPMILYWYLPNHFIAKHLSMNLIDATRVYVFLLMLLSMGLCYRILKHYVNNSHCLLFATIGLVLFVLPMVAFAQREHLLLMFLIPYLLASALKLRSGTLSVWLSVLVGVLAGLVFALKPYFLTVLVLVELLFIYEKASVFAWIRIESIAILIVLCAYLLSVFVYHPGYIHTILPLVTSYYFIAATQPWYEILSKPYVLFCVTMLGVYPLYFSQDQDKILGKVLYAALFGLVLSFLMARNNWYYHVLPAIGVGLLLAVHMFSQVLQKLNENFAKGILAVLMVLFSFIAITWLQLVSSSAIFTRQNPMNQLFDFFNHTQGDLSIDCFSVVGTSSCFPMMGYLKNANYTGKFPSFWWYSGLAQDDLSKSAKLDKARLLYAVADELHRNKPRWVVIDTRNSSKMPNVKPLLAMLNENKFFQDNWQRYTYYTSIVHYQIYLRKAEYE